MKIAIAGSGGRMGQVLLACAADMKEVELLATGARAPAELFAADAVIDFTAPDYTVQLAQEAARGKKIHIIGTTGLSAAQQEAVTAAAKSAVIVQSGNFSLGVNVLASLVEQAARSLPAHYALSITDIHHIHKKDAPSGTALMLKAAANKAGRSDAVIDSIREGEVVGEHRVRFAVADETLTLTHQAFDRAIFARGALHAALWAKAKPAGLYTMRDVLQR